VLLFDLDEFEELCKNSSALSMLYVETLKSTLLSVTRRLESMILHSPEERYENLLKTSPLFFKKAFNKHIANYLGITNVSLSRIIKRSKNR
jgi:CRP-like cAMP-binding protein